MLAGCDGQPAPLALDEPVRVKSAQFIDGALPGSPPGTSGPSDLRVTSITSTSRVALPGQAGKKIDGRASARASAIGIRFADLGSGYWVFPLGAPDPQFPGELSWEAELDFALATSDAPGFHPLRVVAIDAAGVAGEQGELSVCFASRTPDNLSACDPKTPPPDAVITLRWDADLDLDLRVALPSGRTVDPKHPLTDPGVDGGASSPDVGVFSRDSLASCIADGRRQEDLVWQKRPKGTVDLYVQLFDPCAHQSASFTIIVYEAEGQVPNRRLVERFRENGRVLTALSGNESAESPTFVASYDFP
ncbi:MAG: hypothetical protein JWO86_2768 [Myxococcaceae bacterium]|jgi:hypothetical protein|nr:hypothetical protein [Myxococcaceae bacterium]